MAQLVFRDYLARAMVRQRVSKSELARRTKLSRSHVQQILLGKCNPTIDTAEKLAAALGVEIEWPILFWEDTMEDET